MKGKQQTLPVTSLVLDEENPRLPPSLVDRSQRALIHDMVVNEDAYKIAQSIQKNGLYPTELLVAIPGPGGKHIILDGNRRLAAMKCLLQPEFAPDFYRSRFKNISAQIDLKAIQKVKVFVVANRRAAVPLIASRHTAPSVKKWEPTQKGAYYLSLIDRGVTIEEIAEEANTAPGEVKAAIRLRNIIDLAARMPLSPDTRSKLAQVRGLEAATTLQRIFDTTEGRKFLNVEFENEVNPRILSKKNEFKRAFAQIVQDIVTKRVDSRQLNDTQGRQTYFNGLRSIKPTRSAGRPVSADAFPPAGGGTLPGNGKATRAKAEQPPRALLPNDFECRLSNRRINDLCKELTGLPVSRYPNAAALLLRTFVELGLRVFLKRTGDISKIKELEKSRVAEENRKRAARNKPPIQLNPNTEPTLIQMVSYVAKGQCEQLSGSLAKALQKAERDEEVFFDLNLATHNENAHFEDRDVRRIWRRIEGFVQRVCQGP